MHVRIIYNIKHVIQQITALSTSTTSSFVCIAFKSELDMLVALDISNHSH